MREQRTTVNSLIAGDVLVSLGGKERTGRVTAVEVAPVGTRTRGPRGGAKVVTRGGDLLIVTVSGVRLVVSRRAPAVVLTDAPMPV